MVENNLLKSNILHDYKISFECKQFACSRNTYKYAHLNTIIKMFVHILSYVRRQQRSRGT